MKRKCFIRPLLWLLACLIALAPACMAEAATQATDAGVRVECGVLGIKKHGNLVLDISCAALMSQGFEYGDILRVEIAGGAYEIPLCSNYSDVDNGALICRAVEDDPNEGGSVELAINMGDLATWLGIAGKVKIEEDPGFRWDYAGAYADGVSVALSILEKGGYLEQFELHRLTRSNERTDYPDLTDEQYANFRNIATTGMGANVLYRSSSPVNPEINRNREADAAVNAAGIRTVINLTDSAGVMKGYEDYAYTCYAALDVLPLDMVVDFSSEAFRDSLAEGLRFLAAREGPYLVHCTEGKDRSGFVCAVLECLMGATAREVYDDYMLTFYNYYGIAPGDDKYDAVLNSNIARFLARAFGVQDIAAGGVDLSACAKAYLQGLGLTGEEIAALKDRLGTDIK